MDNSKDISLKGLLPYFGSFIIFLGVTRMLFYYGSFGVTITNYLEFSEIITSFLDIIVIVIILFVFSALQNILMKSKKEYDGKILLQQKLIDENNFARRFKLYFSYYDNLIFGLIGTLIVYFIVDLFRKQIYTKIYVYLIVSFLIIFVYAVISSEIEIKNRQFKSANFERQFSRLLLYSLIFIGLTLMYTYAQVESVKTKKTTYGTIITLEDNKVLISDSNNYFIGKTQNFIFYYHERTKTIDIIPVSKLKQLSIPESKYIH